MKDNQIDNGINGKVQNFESVVPLNNSGQELSSFFVRFFKIIYLHKWLFIIVFLIVITAIIFYALSQPKIYQSEHEVFYNETVREFATGVNESSIRSDFDKNYWMSAMQSDELMLMTLKSAGLTNSVSSLKRMISIGMIDKRKEDRIPVYKVIITSPIKEHIPLIIRSYVNSLNELLLTNQIRNSERLVSYLSDQINQNNQKLNQIDIQIGTGGIANSGEIIDFEKIRTSLDAFRVDLLNAQVNLASISSARKRTENELHNLDGTIVNESAFSEPLKVQLMNLEVDLARALTKNKEDHPIIKQIRNNIGQISAMIRDTLEQRLEIRSLVQNPLKSQLMSKLLELKISEVSEETRVASLQKVISELEQKTLPSSINEEQQQTLRNREMVYLTIKQLNDKLIESQSKSHGSLSRFVFIDDPSSIFLANKNFLYFLILALLLGLVIASLIVFFYDLLDDRIMLVEDYEQFYTYPLLGFVRHYKSSENSLLSSCPDFNSHSVSDIGNLVVNLRQTIKHKKLKTIVISSPDRQEGKSLVSLKLASAMAAKKQKVLLVDLDFFSPKLSTRLNPILPAGLSDYLVDDCTLDNIIQDTEIETLKFVSAGNADGQKELFYNDAKLAEFVHWAQANFDIVFFDTPAAMYIPDIVEFFEQMDAIVVVARLRRTTRKLLNRIFSVVSVFKNKYIGVILNDLSANSGDNYSYYSYGSYSDKTGISADESNDNKVFKRPKKYIIFSVIAILALLTAAYLFLTK